MKISLVLAHPRRGSFNHGLADIVARTLEDLGHSVTAHDLYDEGFDPLLRSEECFTSGSTIEDLVAASPDLLVARHRREIAAAEGLVIVHPNWWGKPPAILAGWLDRVLVPGVAYRLANPSAEPEGLLKIRSALVINTTDTPPAREAADLGDPLQSIWARCVLPYCGAQVVDRLVVGPVTDSAPAERADWLSQAASRARTAFGESGIESTHEDPDN